MAKKTETPQVNATTALATTGAAKGGFFSAAIDHMVAKTVPFLPPWIGAYAVPPVVGFATHELWGDAALSSGLASAGVGLAGVALSTLTWSVSGGNNKFRRVRRAHATASVAAGMGWLTCATAAGPFTGGVVDVWLFGGGLFAASWNLRHIMRNAHDETEQTENSGLGKVAEAIGLEKLKVKRAKGNGKGMVTVPVEVAAGQTVDDVQSALPKLAAAMHVPPSGVTIARNADNAAHGTLSIRVADLLKDGVQFIPPARMGMLPTEDIPLGLYADGETFVINPFAADILQHLLVMGVTGAGKSEFARGLIAHLSTRQKMTTILVDCSKGRQSMGHIKDGIDWFITDKSEARRLVKTLPGVIKARGDVLGDEGLDQWTPKSSLNAVLVWVEEAADLADFDELDKVARAARSVGIWLVISLQRATWTNLSTDVRANLQASACFGVDDAGDAGFGLPDRVIEAGAVPDWGSSRPGYAFATGMGIPGNRWSMEWRSGLTDREILAALVAAGTQFRDPLDETTAKAFGLVYAQRAHKGTNRLNTEAPRAVESVPVQAPIDEEEQAVADEIDEVYAQVMDLIPGDPEPDAEYANVRLDDDVPESDPESDMEFAPTEKPSTDDARRVLFGQLDQWAQQGRLEFETGDLAPAVVAAGRTRGWLHRELGLLIDRGLLQKSGHGQYQILQSPLVPA